jgi:hypothetical protein
MVWRFFQRNCLRLVCFDRLSVGDGYDHIMMMVAQNNGH